MAVCFLYQNGKILIVKDVDAETRSLVVGPKIPGGKVWDMLAAGCVGCYVSDDELWQMLAAWVAENGAERGASFKMAARPLGQTLPGGRVWALSSASKRRRSSVSRLTTSVCLSATSVLSPMSTDKS